MQSPNLHIPVRAAIVIPHDQQWIGHAEQAPMTPASKRGTSRHAGRHMLTQSCGRGNVMRRHPHMAGDAGRTIPLAEVDRPAFTGISGPVSCRSVGLQACELHHFGPFFGFVGEELAIGGR